jgi:hypothetical protein
LVALIQTLCWCYTPTLPWSFGFESHLGVTCLGLHTFQCSCQSLYICIVIVCIETKKYLVFYPRSLAVVSLAGHVMLISLAILKNKVIQQHYHLFHTAESVMRECRRAAKGWTLEAKPQIFSKEEKKVIQTKVFFENENAASQKNLLDFRHPSFLLFPAIVDYAKSTLGHVFWHSS